MRSTQPKFNHSRAGTFTLILSIILLCLSTPKNAQAKAFLASPFVGMVATSEGAAAVLAQSDVSLPEAGVQTASSSVAAGVSKASQLFSFAVSDIPPFDDSDDRAVRIDTYFAKRNMPLAGHGDVFISVADGCGLDWQLLPAIAVRESSGGKRMRLNNPFGWASANVPFDDLDDAIRTVGLHLCGQMDKTARYYKDKTTMQKLYAYNGTVMPSYPREVASIMTKF